jgi:hypothetical protein
VPVGACNGPGSVAKIDAAQDDAGRRALERAGLEFARCALFDSVAQPEELLFAPIVQRPCHLARSAVMRIELPYSCSRDLVVMPHDSAVGERAQKVSV